MSKCDELLKELQSLQDQTEQKEDELAKAQVEEAQRGLREICSYWMSHGGVEGKCFKICEELYGRENYYRVHKVIGQNRDDWFTKVALEHIIHDNGDGVRWPFYTFGWNECFTWGQMTPENEIPLSEFNEAKELFERNYKTATEHIKEEML